MGAEQYPEVELAMPSSRVKPTLTTRLLKPGVVIITVVILAATSITGLVVAASILESASPHSMSVMVAQGFVVTAATFSISYISLHIVASKHNDPVGIVRPPVLRLHAACFIIARLALVVWIMAMIASIVALSRPAMCIKAAIDCRSEIIGVVISNLAVLAAGIVLTALEACQYPFQLPEVFHIAKRMTWRVSASFENAILERSISRASSFNEGAPENDKVKAVKYKISAKQKPLPRLPSIPAEDPSERPITPLLPMAQGSNSRGWGQEWTHNSRGDKRKGMTKSDSAVSGMSRSSSGYISSDHSSDNSAPKRPSRPRVVTPSSSISNLTKRSPLSTMRSAEYPDVVVRPDLRYCPPTISAPHEWRLSRTASLNQLLPVADIQYLQRQASFSASHQYMVRRPSATLPPLLAHHRRRTPPVVKRRSSEIRIPGPYLDYRLSMDAERNLEEHARTIEAISISRSESGRELKPRPPPKDPVRRFEKRSVPQRVEKKQTPQRVNSKSRYREPRSAIKRSQTSPALKDIRPHTANQVGTANLGSNVEFRRLSLGDISTGFGKLFNV
ncbi:hypothetical protein G7Y89_g15545 [Cudoniella acicularis]|uniref:Uncharacterized protein n=1 Tax=Cudoniella acicularis TaxID=354080 RepID=A0A8H4QL23_9HELO|nr:hypothetical protein G7Y89_g15545 [Cudoniella acicularis]